MAIQESRKFSLGEKVRNQIKINKTRGDTGSNYGEEWWCYKSNISDYDSSFGLEIKDILKGKENPIVIDFMAPSGTLNFLFKQIPDKNKLGIAISLEDLRTDQERKKDSNLNVVQIPGDILKSSTWEKIEYHLQGRKADLILERAVLGLDCITDDIRIHALLLNKAWQLLSDNNGIFLVEVKIAFKDKVKNLIEEFKRRHEIEISFIENTLTPGIKLIKTPNSPKRLSL